MALGDLEQSLLLFLTQDDCCRSLWHRSILPFRLFSPILSWMFLSLNVLGGRYTPETARGQEPSRQAGRYTAETPVSGQAFNEALQRYAAAASIDKPVSLHGLRHSIARCLYRQCKDPLKIMAFLDHSDLSV